MPGIEFMSWLGLAMAPGTPRPIVERLNEEVRRRAALPDVQERLAEGGNVAITVDAAGIPRRASSARSRAGSA